GSGRPAQGGSPPGPGGATGAARSTDAGPQRRRPVGTSGSGTGGRARPVGEASGPVAGRPWDRPPTMVSTTSPSNLTGREARGTDRGRERTGGSTRRNTPILASTARNTRRAVVERRRGQARGDLAVPPRLRPARPVRPAAHGLKPPTRRGRPARLRGQRPARPGRTGGGQEKAHRPETRGRNRGPTTPSPPTAT